MVFKKLFCSFLASMFLAGFSVSAQMQAARRVTLDVDTSVVFNVKRSVVWDLVKDPSQWNKIYGESVNGFNTIGIIGDSPENPTTMEIKMTYADGTGRNIKVEQFTPQYRFMVLKVLNPVQQGITDNFIGLTVDVIDETSCKLAYRIRVDGPEPAKTELLAELKKEMRIFFNGINKSIL